MNRDATRVFGSESVNRSMNVPVTLKERDEIGEVIWNPIIYAGYRIGWLLHHNDVTKIISDKRLSGCFSGVDASDLLKRNKMDKELFGNLLTSLCPTKGKFENFKKWFSQIVKGEMIKVNESSRCYILRPSQPLEDYGTIKKFMF
jgi:hypothetical protein